MKKTSKLFAAFLMLSLTMTGCSLLPDMNFSQNDTNQSQQQQSEFETKTREIYNLYIAAGGTMTYEDWLASIKGQDGKDGKDGVVPEIKIGPNGNWFVEGTDTGVKAQGSDGQTPYIGNNGNWWIGTTDTGVSARGEGGRDGVGITSTVINSEGELIITFTNGETTNAGKLTFTEHVHEYTSNIVNPTCTVDGYITFTCKTCGHIETVINKASGHIFEVWREKVQPTCTTTGLKIRSCTLCGEREEEIIEAHDHQISDSYIHNAATHWHYCELCGVVVEEENHTYDNDVCSVCNYTKPSQSSESGIIYALNEDGESYSLADLGTCKDTEVDIPEMYNGKPITAIYNGAFSGANVTSVTMTDRITLLGAECFKGCKSLTNVVLSKNIKAIGQNTFDGCSSLPNIIIPDGVESIGDRAFNECTKLESLVFPNSVTSLGYWLAVSCRSLTTLVLPGTSCLSRGYEFYNCTSLENVTITEGCTRLCTYTFASCTSLRSIYIPRSMTRIDGGAFIYSTNLTSAVFGDPENWMVGSDSIAKEVLQDDEVAARKLINSQTNWIKNTNQNGGK